MAPSTSSFDDLYLALDPNIIGLDAFLFKGEADAALDALDLGRLGSDSNGLAGNGPPGWAKDWDLGYVGDWSGGRGGEKGGNGGGGGKPDKPGKPPKDDPPPEDPPDVLSSYTSGGDADFYNIEIIFNGSLWTADLQDDFIAASELLSAIIVGDEPDVTLFGSPIDDIRIEAELAVIDGEYGVLGRAGPQYYRSSNNLPVSGIMEFDVADAERLDDQGRFDDVVFHEMMHVLGFGTMWEIMGLLDTYGSGSTLDYRFNGAVATAMYNSEFADIAASDPRAADGVPVETDGGQGTAKGHWDEQRFDDEIMTGYINTTNYLSDTTVAALEDMGYQLASNAYDVDYMA